MVKEIVLTNFQYTTAHALTNGQAENWMLPLAYWTISDACFMSKLLNN